MSHVFRERGQSSSRRSQKFMATSNKTHWWFQAIPKICVISIYHPKYSFSKPSIVETNQKIPRWLHSAVEKQSLPAPNAEVPSLASSAVSMDQTWWKHSPWKLNKALKHDSLQKKETIRNYFKTCQNQVFWGQKEVSCLTCGSINTVQFPWIWNRQVALELWWHDLPCCGCYLRRRDSQTVNASTGDASGDLEDIEPYFSHPHHGGKTWRIIPKSPKSLGVPDPKKMHLPTFIPGFSRQPHDQKNEAPTDLGSQGLAVSSKSMRSMGDWCWSMMFT